jgi:UDP-N-acetylglucosamine 4,6-dehydratase
MVSTDRNSLLDRKIRDEAASDRLRGATVLITGGTGSFGHAMTRRLVGLGCGEIRIFSRDEAKQDAMRRSLAVHNIRFHIGDVRDRDAVRRVTRGADYVFHAAALKQVPSCEFFPLEAVQTNVLGGANVVREAVAAGSKCVVCLSTDKAVEPVNAMGMSKALMEKVVSAEARGLADGDTVVCSVRYGNVLYSRGSVVPLFIEQAVAGEPLTITDSRMTRFMMSLDEAIDLVEFAFLNAEQGDTFIRKAPAALMADVADVVGTMFCGQPKTRIIGIRHGEKLHETLASVSELQKAEDRGDYFRVPMDARDLDYDKYFIDGDDSQIESNAFTSDSAHRMCNEEISTLLMSIPEYSAALNSVRENVFAR